MFGPKSCLIPSNHMFTQSEALMNHLADGTKTRAQHENSLTKKKPGVNNNKYFKNTGVLVSLGLSHGQSIGSTITRWGSNIFGCFLLPCQKLLIFSGSMDNPSVWVKKLNGVFPWGAASRRFAASAAGTRPGTKVPSGFSSPGFTSK